MRSAESTKSRKIVGRLEKGDELVSAIVRVAKEHNVKAGEIRALGATTYLETTEYDTEAQVYREALVRDGDCEILMLYGNLSDRDGELFAHLHMTGSFFENGEPKLFGGHVSKATVFACEYVIEVHDDIEMTRVLDKPTGLALWETVDKLD